jgi:hypothetical protein
MLRRRWRGNRRIRFLDNNCGTQKIIDITIQYTYNVIMVELRFEWDSSKDALNQRKHGISFSEAQTVFSDEEGLLLDGPDHSAE